MNKNLEFDIKEVMDEVKKNSKRNGFTSEFDLQFFIGVAIKKLYKEDVTIVMEYRYPNPTENEEVRQYLDILVIMNDKYYPIELKYKHKGDNIEITEKLKYDLSNQTCTTDHRKKYCDDIKRILRLRETNEMNGFNFEEGYAILLTNYDFKNGGNQKYSLDKNKIKNGIDELGDDKKYCHSEWEDYDKNGKFTYLITTVKKKALHS